MHRRISRIGKYVSVMCITVLVVQVQESPGVDLQLTADQMRFNVDIIIVVPKIIGY